MAHILNMLDFGAHPDTHHDTMPAVRRVMEKIKTLQSRATDQITVKFPAGEYHFYPALAFYENYFLSNSEVKNPRRIGVWIQDLHDVIVEGETGGKPIIESMSDAPDQPFPLQIDTRFIFHGRFCPIVVDRSQNIILRNLVIDWERVPESEGKVTAVFEDGIELEIDSKQYPFEIRRGKIQFLLDESTLPPSPDILDEAVRIPVSSTPLNKAPPMRVSLRSRIVNWATGLVQGGSVWKGVMEFDPVTRAIPSKMGDNSLGWGWQSYKAKQISPNKVRLYRKFTNPPQVGHWLVMTHHDRDHAGMFFNRSKNLRVENVQLFATDGLGILSQFTENLSFFHVNITPNRALRMFVSGMVDGLHFSNCKGEITVDSCAFEGLMDDPMNVHGTSVRIDKIDRGSNRLFGQFMHPGSKGFIWADSGDIVSFIQRQSMQSLGTTRVKSYHLDATHPEHFIIEFLDPIPATVQANDAMENLTWTPSLNFRHNRVLSCRARGILISTPGKVMIEQNYFKSSGCPILIAGDANSWWESGAVTDVCIRNNDFSEYCLANMYQDCDAIISIAPVVPKVDITTPFHRRIWIEQNHFYPSDYPVLYAKSTTDLVFSGNIIERGHQFSPWHPNKATVLLDGCSKVTIRGNTLVGDVLGKNINIRRMPASEVIIAPNEGLKLESREK